MGSAVIAQGRSLISKESQYGQGYNVRRWRISSLEHSQQEQSALVRASSPRKAALSPEGLIAYVSTYAEATTGVDVSALTPENITAIDSFSVG